MDDNLRNYIKIDKQQPIPLYFQVKQQLLGLIQSKKLQPGEKLPTEIELCALLEISRPTIRQAFSELINEGYVTRLKAKGTFVSNPKIEGYFFQKLESFDDEMRSLHMVPSTNVCVKEVVETPLSCQDKFSSCKAFHLMRVRYANDKEMVYVDTYVPYERFDGIEHHDFEKESLYTIMEQSYDCQIAYVDRVVEAKIAGRQECELLQMEEGNAILCVHTTSFDQQNQVVEFSTAYYRGDRNSFRIRLKKA